FSDREAQKPWIFVGDYRFNWEARVQNDHWASCTASEFALETYSASPTYFANLSDRLFVVVSSGTPFISQLLSYTDSVLANHGRCVMPFPENFEMVAGGQSPRYKALDGSCVARFLKIG
ncbi:hypothetical protein POG22_00560, partial [Geitlerinema sp. CS-897]|nr:hypothetical protein [Geitlerinema sp. CS-897]